MTSVGNSRASRIDEHAGYYTATFELGEDGWWAAQVVEVPEAISQGHTLDEARANVADALALALELRVKEGREDPLRRPRGDRTGPPLAVRRTDLVRWLRAHDCQPVSEQRRGKREASRNTASDATSFVPRHGEIGVGVARKICRQLGI